MASNKFSVINIQNDDQEIDLQFQDFGQTVTEKGHPDKEEQTVYFSEFPDSAVDDPEQKGEHFDPTEKILKPLALSGDNIIVEPILPDNVAGDVKLITVVVLEIKEKRSTSNIMKSLALAFPVPELQHLKRVRKILIEKKESFFVYICPEEWILQPNFMISDEDNLSQVSDSESVWCHLRQKIDRSLFFNQVYLSQVSKYPPRLKELYEECIKYWPCSYHEDIRLTKLLSGTYFTEKCLVNISQCMNKVFILANSVNNKIGLNRAVFINKREHHLSDNSIAYGKDARLDHPLYHATMIAIDNVACNQNGGAIANIHSLQCSDDKVIKKIKYDSSVESLQDIATNADVSRNSYICTGCDVYMTHEPCIMCAMALLHSRVQRVFYFYRTKSGALTSLCKLHTFPGINHRFEVFQIKLKS